MVKWFQFVFNSKWFENIMRCLACRVVDSTWRTLRTLRDMKWRRRTPFLLTLWFLYFQSTAPSSTQERTTDDKQWSLRSGPLFSDATNDKLSSYGKNNENRNSPRKKNSVSCLCIFVTYCFFKCNLRLHAMSSERFRQRKMVFRRQFATYVLQYIHRK